MSSDTLSIRSRGRFVCWTLLVAVPTEAELQLNSLRGKSAAVCLSTPMWGPTTRTLLGFGLFCIVYTFIAPPTLSPGHTISALPWKPWPWPWPWPRFSFDFCKFNQRINVALPDGTGSVRGIRCIDYALDAFLGVPYAKPPVGVLRFNSPMDLATNPSRVFEGSRWGKICLQQTVLGL